MVKHERNVACAALIAATAFAAISLPVAAQVVTTEPGTPFQTPQLTGFMTTAADMVGMMVTLNGGSTAAWGPLAGERHGVTFGDTVISLANGLNSGFVDTSWNVVGDPSNPVNSIKFSGAPGRTIFDIVGDVEMTPGSHNGVRFITAPGGSFSGVVTATYSNVVSLTGQAALGDLYEQLTINFAGGLTGTYNFTADTDNSPSGADITPVPEPGTIGMMLAGLAGVSLLARRRQRKS